MKISKEQSIRHDWENVKSWNYKLTDFSPKQSVVYAELEGDHGEVHTEGVERIYYILDGEGEFNIEGKVTTVGKEDVITVPPKTNYDYKPINGTILKVLLFMDLWDN